MATISRRTLRARALVLSLLVISPGCNDLRDYAGTWKGAIVINPYLRQGFESDTRLTLVVTKIDRSTLVGSLTVGPSQTITSGFTDAPLFPVERASNDVIGDLSFEGQPLATYLFWVAPDDPAEGHALVMISAHPKERMQVRILRHDLYGVFRLARR